MVLQPQLLHPQLPPCVFLEVKKTYILRITIIATAIPITPTIISCIILSGIIINNNKDMQSLKIGELNRVK